MAHHDRWVAATSYPELFVFNWDCQIELPGNLAQSGEVKRRSLVRTVNMLEAKTNLSKLIRAVEAGAETEVIIARNGHPVARLVPIATRQGQRIGIARGAFVVPESIDAENPTVEALLSGSGK